MHVFYPDILTRKHYYFSRACNDPTSEKLAIQRAYLHLYLAGVLIEDFLERIAPSRHWYINLNEKSKKYESSLLS